LARNDDCHVPVYVRRFSSKKIKNYDFRHFFGRSEPVGVGPSFIKKYGNVFF